MSTERKRVLACRGSAREDLTHIFNTFTVAEWRLWFKQGGPLVHHLSKQARAAVAEAMQMRQSELAAEEDLQRWFSIVKQSLEKQTHEQLADRRRQMAEQVQKVRKPQDVAKDYGVDVSSVYNALREHGVSVPRARREVAA